MAISEFHASTILKVRADFGFDCFDCEPDEITRSLGIVPDVAERKGQANILRDGRSFPRLCNSWFLNSRSESKDVNDHLRELLVRDSVMWLSVTRDEFGPAEVRRDVENHGMRWWAVLRGGCDRGHRRDEGRTLARHLSSRRHSDLFTTVT